MNLYQIISYKSAAKLTLIICQLSLVVTLAACQDDDTNQAPSTLPKVENMEMTRLNSFVNIDIPSDTDWEVTANPYWACPIEKDGTANSQLELFVETNEEENDRTDTLTVTTTDGKVYHYVLTQMGTLRDPNNGALLDPNSCKTIGVGYSLNILNNTYASLSKFDVLATSPVNFAKLIAALKQLGEEDAFYEEKRNYSYTENITGNSTEEIAAQLAANANITLGLDAFTATVNGAYKSTSSDTTKYSYAMQEIKHIVLARYLRSDLLRYCAQKDIDVWNTTMDDYLIILKKATNDSVIQSTVKDIVTDYGTHIITYAALGGEMRVSMKMKYTERNKDTDIHGALNIASKIVNSNGDSVSYSSEEKNIAKNTTLALKVYGGKASSFGISTGATFEAFQKNVKNNMKKWANGIQSSKALIDIEIVPLWDLMPTEASRNAMRKYIMIDLQSKKFNDKDYRPALYRIEKFYVDSKDKQWAHVILPKINREVYVERTDVPRLSEDELSTIIYSGLPNNVNYNCGFFVGNSKHKPAKVRFDDNDNITSIEPLDGIGTIVNEVYIDATGDITLMPKSFSDLYTPIEIGNWTAIKNY